VTHVSSDENSDAIEWSATTAVAKAGLFELAKLGVDQVEDPSIEHGYFVNEGKLEIGHCGPFAVGDAQIGGIVASCLADRGSRVNRSVTEECGSNAS
jgi:hypothetical protein